MVGHETLVQPQDLMMRRQGKNFGRRRRNMVWVFLYLPIKSMCLEVNFARKEVRGNQMQVWLWLKGEMAEVIILNLNNQHYGKMNFL